jgi:hypothetical protein
VQRSADAAVQRKMRDDVLMLTARMIRKPLFDE